MNPATLEAQRRDSLREANQVRRLRADLKAAITAGDTALAEAFAHPDDWTQRMRVAALLRAVPRIGPAKISRALTANRISPSLTLEHFPKWRQDQLLAWLQTNCPSVRVYPEGRGE